MTIFAKKTMHVSDWSKVQDQIGELQMALGRPHDLMMFSTSTRDFAQKNVYIGLPTATYLAAFPGFEEISQESLPDRLSTIVAREDEFEERFPDIFKKRQAAVRGGRE
jgi:hypothetical protein